MASSTAGQQHHQQQPPESTSATTSYEIQTPNSHITSPSTNPTQNHPPPSLSTSAAPSTNATATNASSFNGRKRPLNDHFALLQTSPYFKMRAVLTDLRSLFLQVLRAPDIQNCDAAHGLQEKLKLILDLCKQKTVENVTMAKCNSKAGIQETAQLHRNIRPAEERRFAVRNYLEKPESNKISGTYIVGGSAFGWNFITFHGTKPEYYGRTKEAFRAGK